MAQFLPAVILVRPQLPENVGGAARVLHNFGFCDLRFVNPKIDFANDQKAIACACLGSNLLAGAKVYDSVESAVSDLDYLYATTARIRYSTRRCIPSAKLSIKTKNTGILFGPENAGLANADITLCDELVFIEAACNPLNLVHAIAIIAHQCFNTEAANIPSSSGFCYASKKELSFLYDSLGIALDNSRFFSVKEKKITVMQNLAAMFSRMQPTSQDVKTILGILRSLSVNTNNKTKLR